MLQPEVGLELGRAWPRAEEILVLEERVDAAQAEAEKHAARERSAALAGNQHIGAGRALRVFQVPVLLHNELAAQRNHEQHSKPAADEREKKDARVVEIESEKNKRRQREDDSGSDGLARVAG